MANNGLQDMCAIYYTTFLDKFHRTPNALLVRDWKKEEKSKEVKEKGLVDWFSIFVFYPAASRFPSSGTRNLSAKLAVLLDINKTRCAFFFSLFLLSLCPRHGYGQSNRVDVSPQLLVGLRGANEPTENFCAKLVFDRLAENPRVYIFSIRTISVQ